MSCATIRTLLLALAACSAALAGTAEIGFVVGQWPTEKLTPESHGFQRRLAPLTPR